MFYATSKMYISDEESQLTAVTLQVVYLHRNGGIDVSD